MSDFEDFLEEEELSEAQTEDTVKRVSRLVKRFRDLEQAHEKLKLEAVPAVSAAVAESPADCP